MCIFILAMLTFSDKIRSQIRRQPKYSSEEFLKSVVIRNSKTNLFAWIIWIKVEKHKEVKSLILHVPISVPQRRSLNFYCPPPPSYVTLHPCHTWPPCTALYTCTVHTGTVQLYTLAPSAPELSSCQHSRVITPGTETLLCWKLNIFVTWEI